jgi:hypothetical protein
MTSSTMLTRTRLTILAATAAVAALVVAAPAAQAGPLVASAPDCDAQPLTQPFTPWLDPATYQFAPDGGFESGGAGWDLNGNAATVSGNETSYVHDAGDSASLSLPAGSSAVSPTVCVGLEHPTIRFFSKRASGLTGTAAVEVLFETATGNVVSAPVGVVTAVGSWQPTLPMPIVANLLPLLPGEYTPVEFKVTTLTGTVRIDDFYVDPHSRG